MGLVRTRDNMVLQWQLITTLFIHFFQTWLWWPWKAPSVFCDVTSPLTGLIFYGLSPRGWKGHRRLSKLGGDKTSPPLTTRIGLIVLAIENQSPCPQTFRRTRKAKSKDTKYISDVRPRYISSVTKPTFYNFYISKELIYIQQPSLKLCGVFFTFSCINDFRLSFNT